MPKRVPASMLKQFQTVGGDLFLQGLNSSHSGNLSIRKGEMIWITRRGAPLGRLKAADIVGVDLRHPEPMARFASRELPSHVAIYAHGLAGAVVHAHPPAAVALSLSRDGIVPLDLEGGHHIPRVGVVVPPGPYDPHRLAGPVGQALREARVAVIRAHGTFSWGADLWEAFRWTSTLEHSCRILLLSRLGGP